ncbi:MAG: hypothetical protein DMG64_06035 [Acidobacteria bacterium]|nr:MAG: hypothetical protein DMG63_04320 [Acidobacteriota bacterium]PYY03946.1 MAG: hypothetical protein DMG64_06035 [Acidobacteriota bacterium]PYY21197.1 MAG: hypothetical protein DMG62_19500 [Acidobacteriota bacterium]
MADSDTSDSVYGIGRQALRFSLHEAAVYVIASFCIGILGGWVWSVLPFFNFPRSGSSLQFLYNHLFVLSVVPAFLTGLLNARFRHSVAQFVWVLPAILLAYRLITFPEKASVLAPGAWPAFHYYFGGGFLIGEYHSWREFYEIIFSSNPDISRAFAQQRLTAPFYAGIAYSFSIWWGLRRGRIASILQAVRDREIRGFELEEPASSEATIPSEQPPAQQRAPVQ